MTLQNYEKGGQEDCWKSMVDVPAMISDSECVLQKSPPILANILYYLMNYCNSTSPPAYTNNINFNLFACVDSF